MRHAYLGMVWLNGLANNGMGSVYSLKGPAVCEIMERFVSGIPRTEREYSHFPPVHSPTKCRLVFDNLLSIRSIDNRYRQESIIIDNNR
jgi:hypothetical protein